MLLFGLLACQNGTAIFGIGDLQLKVMPLSTS